MSSLLTIAPPDTEPLPVYSRRDPDSVSLMSSAPSYVSETPSYEYSLPSLLPPLRPDQEVARGLVPAPRYAPGFQNRAHPGSVSMDMAMMTQQYQMPRWSSMRTANNARQYDAVARRRANTQVANTTALLNSLAAVPPSSSSSSSSSSSYSSIPTSSSPRPASPQNRPTTAHRSPTTTTSTSTSTTATTPTTSSLLLPLTDPSPQTQSAYPVRVGSSSDPHTPLEDPYLVGEEAADRARQQRVYREMCLRGEEAARFESRSWDFMMGQMSDWEERNRSWKGFRKSVGNAKGVLGRRLAIGRAW